MESKKIDTEQNKHHFKKVNYMLNIDL